MPGSFTDYAEAKLLDHWFGGNTMAVPTLHLGYFLTASSENGHGAEPNGNGYLRTPVPPETWLLSTAQLTQNIVDIVCPRSTGEQGEVVGVGVFDSSVGGNCLVYFEADSPLLIQELDSLVIMSGALVHQWTTGGFSNYLKNKIFNHIYKGIPMGVEPTLYGGLMTTAPSDATAGNEPAGGGYVRIPVANNGANFAATSGGIKQTAATIQFPLATALWGSAGYFGWWNSVSGGQFLAYGVCDPIKTVDIDDQLAFKSGDIQITLD